ncbi:MAG: N-formylglutamate amidohydrolase [Myxococcota bacterium]
MSDDRSAAKGPRAPRHAIAEAYEVYGFPGSGPLLITCEHASNRLPDPLPCTESDRAILQTHWGIDIGARAVCMEMVERSRSTAVMARFSRLVIDPNRHPDRTDLIKPSVENTPLSFNHNLSEADRQHRIAQYHEAYHLAIDRSLTQRRGNGAPLLLLSMHSFTPIWDRALRTMDVGILFSDFEQEATQLKTLIEDEGFFVALNAPYSAKFGLMYAAERHGVNHGVTHLELEINQAQICTPARARYVAERLTRAVLRLPRFQPSSA